ncbi:MAG: cation:proton antiporter [Planctomycetota bacterium]
MLLSTNELQGALLELALLFALCVGVAVTFHRFRLPPIVGFLVAGVLVGPNAIGLVQHKAMVEHLAEVGVVVLLFAVGLEVPLGQIQRLRRAIFVGGGLQIVGTIAATAAVAMAFGASWQLGVLLGFLIALSSTAAATKILVDQGELAAPHGRVVLGVMIAQDLAVVPMILLLPFVVGGGDGGAASPLRSLANLGLLAAVLAAARLLVGPLVRLVARTRNRELFVLFLATWCLSLAAVTAALELSLALGAFLAGVLLADSDHHSQAAAETEPFRDAFASLFFVSIGMLFDAGVVAERPLAVGVGLAAVLVGKAALMAFAVGRLGQPRWVQLRAALTAAQVGEFSFVLVQLAKQKNKELLAGDLERVFLVVAVLSIAVTPLLYALGKRLAARARDAAAPAAVGTAAVGTAGSTAGSAAGSTAGSGEAADGHHAGIPKREHAIVVGFGPTGRTIAAGLQAAGVPYVVAEMNADTVKAEKLKGTPIVLADCTRQHALEALGVHGAQLLVLAVNDGAATSRIAQLARQLAPDLHVLARSTYTAEADGLRRAGATDVVPQELEASVEMLVRTLRRFLVADDEIGRQVRGVRARAGGERLAEVAGGEAAQLAEFVPGIGFAVFRVQPAADCLHRTLAEVGIRRRTGCSVVAVRREGENLGAITPDTVLAPGDAVVVIGPKARLADAAAMFADPGRVG